MDYFKEVNAYTMLNAINIFDEKLFNPSKKRRKILFEPNVRIIIHEEHLRKL